MWMRVCVESRSRAGEHEEEGTTEQRKHFWKMLLCLGWRALNTLLALKWVKLRALQYPSYGSRGGTYSSSAAKIMTYLEIQPGPTILQVAGG